MNTAFTGAALLSIGGTISACITWGAIAILVISILHGMSRGMYKTAIRIITLGLAVYLTYHLTEMITGILHDMFVDQTVEQIITRVWADYSTVVSEKIRGIINSFDATTMERLVAAATVIVAMPVVFVAVFYILKILSMFVYYLLHAIFRVGKKNSMVSKLMGIMLGIIQGAVVIWALLMPVAGLAGLAEEAKPVITHDKDEAVVERVNDIYENYIDDVTSNVFIKLVRGFGADHMFSSITTVTVGDESVDMKKQAIVIANIVADGYPLMDGSTSWTDLSDSDKNALLAILDDVGSDEYTAEIIAGVLRGMVRAHGSGYFDFGLEEPLNTFLLDFIKVFENADASTVKEDLRTFLDVYFILNDAGVLSHFGGGESASAAEELLGATDAEGNKVITKIINKLSENPRTSALVTSLTKFSLKLMAESTGNLLPEGVDADKIYDDVKVGMQDVLLNVNDASIPEEEKHEVVKESLNNTLIESGVVSADAPLSDDAMNSITDYVMENFAGKEELTDEDINNAIFSYYNQYGIPEGVNPDNVVIPGTGDGEGDVENTEPVQPEIPEGDEPAQGDEPVEGGEPTEDEEPTEGEDLV